MYCRHGADSSRVTNESKRFLANTDIETVSLQSAIRSVLACSLAESLLWELADTAVDDRPSCGCFSL